jgi:hypothetical protein
MTILLYKRHLYVQEYHNMTNSYLAGVRHACTTDCTYSQYQTCGGGWTAQDEADFGTNTLGVVPDPTREVAPQLVAALSTQAQQVPMDDRQPLPTASSISVSVGEYDVEDAEDEAEEYEAEESEVAAGPGAAAVAAPAGCECTCATDKFVAQAMSSATVHGGLPGMAIVAAAVGALLG